MKRSPIPYQTNEALNHQWLWKITIGSSILCLIGGLGVICPLIINCPELLGHSDLIGKLAVGAIGIAILGGTLGLLAGRKLVAEMSSRLQALSKYLQDAGHELATPVSILKARLQVIERKKLNDCNADSDLEVLVQSTRQLASLIEEMRSLDQAESPIITSHISIINLGEVVQSSVEQLKDAIDSRNLAVELQISQPNTLFGKQESIEQLVSNLLSNAIKHGRLNGRVTLRVSSTRDTVILQVEDDGPGIAPDLLPFLFERFFRGHSNVPDSAPGSGLGLSIVKAIVERHSGQVTAESSLGQFTRFTVKLPKTPIHPVLGLVSRKT